MSRWRKLTSVLVALAAILGGVLGLAHAQPAAPAARAELSRGVIVLPGARASGLADLHPGDTPMLAGQPVVVKMTDAQAGLLVASDTLPDADLAQALVSAGVDAEVNHPRHVLPMTPTAELFRTPQSVRPEDLPNQPDFWHVEQVGADIVHDSGATGAPTTIVGVIDTGVYTSHPLLADVLLPGFDFVAGDAEPDDQVGHGTHVAGIVHSICPRCSILPVKVLDYFGGDDYTIARGIRYARQRGARIIQISLGGPAPSATMCQAIQDVEAQGAEVVIAAGNAAGNSAEAIGYPALCSPASLVVSAANRYDIPAWFSNYGPTVDLAAPGQQVWSTVPLAYDDDGLIPASGTSMAAPQVSGAVALLWSAHPDWTAPQIADRLITTARDIGTLVGIDDGYGPRLDLAQAFGLRSRPIVVGMTSSKPWLPRSGSAAARTTQVRAHVRGDAVSAVRLRVTINGATTELPMALQGGDSYALNYTAPENTAYWRDIILQVVAENDAGSMYGAQEWVIQDGATIPPATIEILNGPPRAGQPVRFAVHWDGTWNNFDFDCGDYFSPIIFYNLRDQVVTCRYDWTGVFFVHAFVYYQDTWKTAAELEFEVAPPPPIYLPIVVR
jgi:subtilisin family serine protease